jgi:hypothetical protein
MVKTVPNFAKFSQTGSVASAAGSRLAAAVCDQVVPR